MKPFWGIDLTHDKKNEQPNGKEFLIARPSSDRVRTVLSLSKQADNAIDRRSKFPLVIRILHWFCGVIGVCAAIDVLDALTEEGRVSFSEAYQNIPWLFWLAGGCLSVWLIFKILSVKKEKRVLECDELKHTLSSIDSFCNAIYSELSVPADAQTVDLLSFFYKSKNSDIKVIEKGFQVVPYFNLAFKIFADSENLYLMNLDGKYSFPLSSLQAIRFVNKKIGASQWNKEEAPNKGIYKHYKITRGNYGCIHFKPYYILELDHNGETWGIYFPCYELPVFEALTGMKAR